jgi:hypothetical protein
MIARSMPTCRCCGQRQGCRIEQREHNRRGIDDAGIPLELLGQPMKENNDCPF